MSKPHVSKRESDIRWDDHERIHDAEERARGLALEVLRVRLENMNNFREQMAERERTFVTKADLYGTVGAVVGIGGLVLLIVSKIGGHG